MKKVILIYLPHPYLNQPDAQAPLGLLYLAAVLEKEGIDVQVKNYSSCQTYQAVMDLPEADIYGITATSLELPQANRFACLIKEKFPISKIILGGPGAYSKEFVDWTFVDSICIGDGESTILSMYKDIEKEKLVREYFNSCATDINNIPFPARHLLEGKQGGNIFAFNEMYRPGDTTIVISSRGCPFNCSFCGSPFFTKQRGGVQFRSIKNIVEEIKQIKSEFGIEQIRFSDDLFTANKKRCLELCSELRKLNIVYRVSIRTKPFDLEIANALYDSGCREVSFGVESFDEDVLALLNKGTTALDNASALELCSRVGLRTRILFMIRTPGQTRETVRKNIEWLNKVPYDIIACTSFVPLPGSDIWVTPEKYNIEILSRNLDHYNFYFFGSQGENALVDVIKIKDRSLEEFNEESQMFRDFLKSTEKVNKG
jgi:anaerobic magnesium-protoporphyrin IX monomethyl ester cyclase